MPNRRVHHLIHHARDYRHIINSLFSISTAIKCHASLSNHLIRSIPFIHSMMFLLDMLQSAIASSAKRYFNSLLLQFLHSRMRQIFPLSFNLPLTHSADTKYRSLTFGSQNFVPTRRMVNRLVRFILPLQMFLLLLLTDLPPVSPISTIGAGRGTSPLFSFISEREG
jgi:hypothetical protein